MGLPLPSSSGITHHPSTSSFPARFPEGTRLLPPGSADTWGLRGAETLQDQLWLAFALWETPERPTTRPYDPEEVSEAILQMPNNQQFRLFQGVSPSCWLSKCLPPSCGPYYSVRGKVKVCGQKAIPSSPIVLLSSLSSPCLGAELLLALAPALQFWVYMGASLGCPSPRGSRGHQATSPSPRLPDGQRVSRKGPDLQQGSQHQCSMGREHSSPNKAASPKRHVAICLVLAFAVPQQQDRLSPQSQRLWGSAHPSPPTPRQRPCQLQCAGGPYRLSTLAVFPWEGGHKERGRGSGGMKRPSSS